MAGLRFGAKTIRNKRKVDVIMKRILLAAITVMAFLGTFTFAGTPNTAGAAEATVGYVNMDAVFEACPGTNEAAVELRQLQATLQKQFEEESPPLDDAAKAKLEQELNAKLAKRQQELMDPIQKRISRAIRQVAQEKGIPQIVKAEVILYGGKDLTKDVITAVKA